MNRLKISLLCAVAWFSLVSCADRPVLSINMQMMPPLSVFTVIGSDGIATVRALTQSAQCPSIAWDARPAEQMRVRASAGTVPARSDALQSDSKEAVFDVLTCEAAWPVGAATASINGQSVPVPSQSIKRIVIVADTGCRMKASDNAFQPCNDLKAWPWMSVANAAAGLKPDLVLHIGDIHYRESPCPQGLAGCAGSAWGYGYDAWRADFFEPAKTLLGAAPWVFVRGNHESCNRAGQGWFRFIDVKPWSEERSCNDPKADKSADYSHPYGVPLSKDTQLIVFDSSKTSGKPLPTGSAAYQNYADQMTMVADLSKRATQNFFASHHPLLAIGSDKKTGQVVPAGNAGLLSVLGAVYPDRLFPAGVNVAMHGHNHVFQAMDFKSDHPVSLVMGNSASQNEFPPPAQVPQGFEPYTNAVTKAVVDHYAAYPDYGFATLDLQQDGAWLLTEYSVQGKPVLSCKLSNHLAADQKSKEISAKRSPLAEANAPTADALLSKMQVLATQIGCSSVTSER
jgi:Calcineurin-like phosphoesterase